MNEYQAINRRLRGEASNPVIVDFVDNLHTVADKIEDRFPYSIYKSWIGKRVSKEKYGRQPKPFKSGFKINTVKSVIEHPILSGKPAFTFNEDESFVRCSICTLVPE